MKQARSVRTGLDGDYSDEGPLDLKRTPSTVAGFGSVSAGPKEAARYVSYGIWDGERALDPPFDLVVTISICGEHCGPRCRYVTPMERVLPTQAFAARRSRNATATILDSDEQHLLGEVLLPILPHSWRPSSGSPPVPAD